jgi:uncharacterized protein involved in exopolysaccharide biosynthesis
MTMKFSEMQKVLSEKLDIVHLSDVARELSVSPQVVNNWKKRNKIPYKYVKKIREIEKDKYQEENLENDDLRFIKALNRLDPDLGSENSDTNLKDDFIKIVLFFKNALLSYYKFIILFTVIVSFTTGFYVFYISPIVYKTTLTILPVSSENNNQSIGGIASQFGLNVNTGSNNLASVQLIPDLILSRSLLSSLLKREVSFTNKQNKIKLLYHYFGTFDDVKSNHEFYMAKGVSKLRDEIFVKKRKLNDMVDITVSASDAKAVVDISLGVVEELDKIQKQISLSRAKEKLKYISERLLNVQEDLKVLEEQLKEFREKNRNISGSPSLQLAENRIIREVASVSSLYNTLKGQYEITRIEETGSSKLIQIIDKPSKPIYRSSPRRTRSVVLSIIIGFSFSIVIVYLKEIYPSLRDDFN